MNNPKNEVLTDGLNFETSTAADEGIPQNGQDVMRENIEINNMTDTPNNTGINNGLTSGEGVIQKPQIKEIVISRPIAEGKSRPKPIEQPKKPEFVF